MRRQTVTFVFAMVLAVAAVSLGGVAGATTATETTVDAGTAPVAADASANASANASQHGETLTIVSYNDIQTGMSDPETVGRLVGTIQERRAAHENPTVVIGGGDEVSPSSLSPVSNWTVPIGVLNIIDPAAEVVANHDLDYGFDAVPAYANASEFPWLQANVVTEDGGTVPGTQNYTVVEAGNVTVGVIGLVDEAIKPKTAVDFAANGYEVADFSEVGSRIATELKTEQNVDVVVATAHIGVPDSKKLARETENIDVIVTGDDEIEYPPQVTDGTVITEAAGTGEFVGELTLTVTDDGVSMDSGRLIPVDEDAPVDETARSYVNESRGKFLSTVAGRTEVVMNSTFANYNVETRWGNLVTDAFRAKTGAEVAITNSGGIRGDFTFGPGEITYDDVYTSLPFGNTLVTKELSGRELVQFLESQVTTLQSEDGQRFGEQAALQVSGVTYEYVPHQSADRLVRDVHVDGEPVRTDETYTVTVNSFMADWTMFDYGWSMPEQPTVREDLTLYGTTTVEYIEANSPVSPEIDGHIQRVDASVAGSLAESGETVTATIQAPAGFEGLNGPVVLTAPGADAVTAESASYDAATDEITATFDAADVESVSTDAETTGLELYAPYDSSRYDLVFHDHARLNADVALSSIETTLPGAVGPPTSVDGDPILEDVNGDGVATVADVRTLLSTRNAPTVQSNPARFDVDGDGDVDLGDVVALFEDVSG